MKVIQDPIIKLMAINTSSKIKPFLPWSKGFMSVLLVDGTPLFSKGKALAKRARRGASRQKAGILLSDPTKKVSSA